MNSYKSHENNSMMENKESLESIRRYEALRSNSVESDTGDGELRSKAPLMDDFSRRHSRETKARLYKLLMRCKNANDYMLTPLYYSFSSLMLSLILVGLHYSRRVGSGGNMMALPTWSQVYCWSVASLLWLSTLLSFSSLRIIKGISNSVFFNILSVSFWLLLSALNATNFLRASHSPKSKRKFFLGFALLSGGHFTCPLKMKRVISISTMISWMLIIFNCIMFGFLTFRTPVLDKMVDALPALPALHGATRLIIKCLIMIVAFFMSCAWIFPSTLELAMSLLIYSEFKLFRKSFSAQISDSGVYKGVLEADRRRYLEMVNIVSAADRCLSLHHGATFCCGIITICLTLYSVCYYPVKMQLTTTVIALIFWMVASLLDIGIMCVSGILVHSAVSRVSDLLCHVFVVTIYSVVKYHHHLLQ
jgi:hypothetical protein